jgi:hypothetical protein
MKRFKDIQVNQPCEPGAVSSIIINATLSKICKGMTTKNIFLSFSDKNGLMNDHPVPINAINTNKTSPFKLNNVN